ncbi:MAG: precorrin-8X methylmutase [Oscillospiraceae bacterium]|nr:precorrin-8X methylmutase [Oscillospiraceae bacterium]
MDMTPLEFFSQERFQGFKPGFARTQALLDALGNPVKQLRFVHVAGTNGKGSVCACLASILTKAGYKTGLYTSHYVVTWNERVQVCGEYISEEDLEEAVGVIAPIAEAMEDAPTQFEVETALAIWYFAHVRCDIAVLEVGMGGEWDATNVIPAPEAAVICAIGLDHTGVLGSTPGEIAAVKAGIIKPGCAVASYGSGEEAEAVIEARCAEKGCPLVRADLTRLQELRPGLEGCRFNYGAYQDLFVPLAGTYQPRNAALAITAAELLRTRGWNIAEEHIREGLASVRWPGRFEVLRREPIFSLDGSHIPHGMAATAESLRTYFRGEKLWFVIGVMADKDVAETALKNGTTRACAAVDKAVAEDRPVIFVSGNAPTFLIRLHEHIANGYSPAFVVAAPVGFVNVIDSKEMIMGDGVPQITVRGRKGGSNVAAAIVNAMLIKVIDRMGR